MPALPSWCPSGTSGSPGCLGFPHGGFSKIFKVLRQEDQQHYALKFTCPADETAKRELINEIGVMRSVHSDYIVRCVDAYDYSDRLWIILEMMEAGALTKIILDRRGYYSEHFCKYAIYCVARALKALHDKNIIHRDIKSDNVLVKYNGEIKLADMGFSVYLTQEKQFRESQKGTPSWMAPEIV